MIFISGLIPDFSAEAEVTKAEEAALLEFNYDNSLEEIDSTMKSFQMKYSGKRWKIMIAAYSVLCVAAIVFIIMSVSNPVGWLAFAVCAYGLIYTATDKKRMRNKTIDAIKDMPPEDYKATVYSDKIEIETIIKPKENEIEMKTEEDEEIENIAPIKNVFYFGKDYLEFLENSESLMLVVARRQTYCFPKRCMTKNQEDELREILETKLDIV